MVDPAGLLLYPLTFFLSDLVTEVYGATKATMMVYLAFGLSILSCFIITITLLAPSPTKENYQQFQNVFCLSGVLLIASLTAYVVSQIVDIHIYSILKLWTGESYLWLRNNVSTLIAQLMDTIFYVRIRLSCTRFSLFMDMFLLICIENCCFMCMTWILF